MKLFAKLSLFVLVLFVTLVLAEVGAHVWLTRFAGDAAFQRYASVAQLEGRFFDDASRRYTPHRYLGYTITPGYAQGDYCRHNSLGFRGAEFPAKKPPGEFRIACIGSSTTYESSIRDDIYTYPAAMESALHQAGLTNARVINAGCGGWDSFEDLINFQFRLLPLDVDMIIVYEAINDVHARLVWPPERYRSDNSGRRESVLDNVVLAPWWQSFTIMRIVGVNLGWMKPHSHSQPLRLLFDAGTPWYHADQFRSQLIAGKYPSGIFKEHTPAEMFAANPPVNYERNLTSLITLAKAHGIDVVLATFAHCRGFPIEPSWGSDEYAAAIEEMNVTMKKLAAQSGAHLFDFATVFPQDKSLYTEGVHVNWRGGVQKGRAFAKYLLDNQLVPKPKA